MAAWNSYLTFGLIAIINESLQLDVWNLVLKYFIDILISCVWPVVYVNTNHGDGVKFLGYVQRI